MSKENLRVPYGMTVHGKEEIDAVVKVLETSTQMGKNVKEFEEKVANLFNKRSGVMVNSGSSALYLGMEVLNLPKESEVITPALTFSTTVGCIIKNGLIPAFVDTKRATYCIDAGKIEEMIGDKTKAVCIPNLIGNIPDWDEIKRISDKYDLKIIEDSADTLGGIFKNKSSGYYSDISTTSFYGSHVINCAGNGGMLCLNDEDYIRKARLLRSWGRSSSIFADSEQIENRLNISIDGISYDSKFVFEEIGYNLEPSELGAAFGLVQLSRLEENIEKRIMNFNSHMDFFSSYQEWLETPLQTPYTRTGWLAFPLLVKDEAPFSRKDLQIHLEKRNIQTRVIFTGNILRQPGFVKMNRRTSADGYYEADRVMRGGMLIGCHHGLDQEMITHIYETFEEFAKRY